MTPSRRPPLQADGSKIAGAVNVSEGAGGTRLATRCLPRRSRTCVKKNPVNHGSSPSGTHRVRMPGGLTQSPPVNSSEEVRPRARFRFPFGGRSPAAEICGHYRNARRSLLARGSFRNLFFFCRHRCRIHVLKALSVHDPMVRALTRFRLICRSLWHYSSHHASRARPPTEQR